MNIPKIPKYFAATIPAGESRSIDATFRRWFIVSATGVLNIKTSFSAKQAYSERSGEEAEEGVLYERLEIFNETANPIDCVIFYGFGNFIDKRNENQGAVSVTASALPAGAATAAKQDTGNVSLASIDGKTILPAALDDAGRLKVGANALGAQANAWNAAATGAGGFSAAVDTLDASNVSAFGTSDGATTFTVQVSQDGIAFYDTATAAVLAGAGDFHVSLSTAAKHVRLKSSNNVNATATIAAKA